MEPLRFFIELLAKVLLKNPQKGFSLAPLEVPPCTNAKEPLKVLSSTIFSKSVHCALGCVSKLVTQENWAKFYFEMITKVRAIDSPIIK